MHEFSVFNLTFNKRRINSFENHEKKRISVVLKNKFAIVLLDRSDNFVRQRKEKKLRKIYFYRFSANFIRKEKRRNWEAIMDI